MSKGDILVRQMPSIVVNPEECRRCLLCQLACSAIQERSFNPAKAKIKIGLTQRKEGKYLTPISFTDDCKNCGICVSHCYYGALTGRKKTESGKKDVKVSSDHLDYR